MWKWLRDGLALKHRLRPRYVHLLSWPQILGLLITLPLSWRVMGVTFAYLGVPMDFPVRSIDGTPLFLGLIFLIVFIAIIAGCALGLLGLGLYLRFLDKWEWHRVWRLFARNEVPVHWLRVPPSKGGA